MDEADYLDLIEEEHDGTVTQDGVYIHPGQTTLREGPYDPSELHPCFWCGAPASYGRIELGGKCPVEACALHYHTVVAPAFEERERKQAERRATTARARKGKQ